MITKQHAADLMAALRGETQGNTVEQDTDRFDVGCVWYGNWYADADRGRFGGKEKPNHNACIARRPPRYQKTCTLSPITSKKKSGKSIFLPRGTIPGGDFVHSYILPGVRLAARQSTLVDGFEFKCRLPEPYLGSFVAAFRNRWSHA